MNDTTFDVEFRYQGFDGWSKWQVAREYTGFTDLALALNDFAFFKANNDPNWEYRLVCVQRSVMSINI